jgi:predicted anti-sigma-YlaC factor YlaD
MHQPIRENLEEYLKGSARQVPQEFQAHLEVCGGCAGELHLLEQQAEMLRSLHSTDEVEPSPGFYARVMERIEEQGRSSIWSVFLQPSFGRRLAIASATLVVLLGTYLVTTESGDQSIVLSPSVIATDAGDASAAPGDGQNTLQQQRQRDAVLEDLASYHE